ncbi:MAG: heavy metal-binding domain-containing protein [Opitutaceae bacterium]
MLTKKRLLDFLFIAGLVLFAGCASVAFPPTNFAEHPANPEAEAASLPPPSSTLSREPAQPEPRRENGGMPATHDHSIPRDEEQQTAHPSGQPDAAVSYISPMHPDVTSDKPARCSKCGMALERKS